jgi:hypothetical protein
MNGVVASFRSGQILGAGNSSVQRRIASHVGYLPFATLELDSPPDSDRLETSAIYQHSPDPAKIKRGQVHHIDICRSAYIQVISVVRSQFGAWERFKPSDISKNTDLPYPRGQGIRGHPSRSKPTINSLNTVNEGIRQERDRFHKATPDDSRNRMLGK